MMTVCSLHTDDPIFILGNTLSLAAMGILIALWLHNMWNKILQKHMEPTDRFGVALSEHPGGPLTRRPL